MLLSVVAVLGSVLLAGAPVRAHGGHAAHPGGPGCDPEVLARFADLDDAMRHLQEQLERPHGRRGKQAHLQDDMGVALERMERARAAACRASRPDVVVVAPPRAPAVHVLDRAGEESLVSALRRASFEDERLAVLSVGVRDVCVTAEQAKGFVQELTFSRGRMDALHLVAPRIVDRERSFVLFDVLSFESDRREARNILTVTQTAPECRLPPRA